MISEIKGNMWLCKGHRHFWSPSKQKQHEMPCVGDARCGADRHGALGSTRAAVSTLVVHRRQ